MSELTVCSQDGLKLAAEVQRPEGPARAVVALLHDAADHRGRYAALQRVLLGAGVAVAALDLRGLGRSAGPRGHVQAWAEYRWDAAALVTLARSVTPDRPVFLMGQGMGGLIALDYALHHPEGLAGVVASAPALLAAGLRRPLHEAWLRILARVAPQRPVALPWAGSSLSHDRGVVAAHQADPWVQRTMTARWAAEMMRTMAAVRGAAPRFALPLLMLHGTADPVYDVAGSEAFKAAYGHRDVTLRTYDGSLHEMHHDLGRFQYERDLLRWLRERAMRRAPAVHAAPESAPSL